jgi:Protein of unknown function (DUF2924)
VKPVSLSLTELGSLDRSALAERWEAAFGVPAPKSCQATLLRQALAWWLQIKELEAVSGPRESRRASRALKQAAAGAATRPGIGTRLLREWQGRTHHVTVVEGGFEYDGRVWKSLSAIASSITGTRWSGPLFFGLRS